MKGSKKDFALLLRGYKIVFSIDAALIPLNIIGAILEAIFPFINIFMGAEILNALTRGDDIRHIYILLIITLSLNVITQQTKQIIARTINIKNQVFEHKFKMYLNSKTLDMEYGSVENPETHMKRQRIDDIRNANGFGVWIIVYQSKDMVSSLFTIITSIAITYKAFIIGGAAAQDGIISVITSPFCSAALLLFIVINTFLTMYFNTASNKKFLKIWDDIIKHNRMFNYILGNYISSYHAGKDIRLYNQKHMIMDNLNKLTNNIAPILNRTEHNQIKYSNINTVLSSIIGLLVYVFVGVKALYKLFSLGDLFKYINGITQFSAGLNGFLNSFNTLRMNSEFLEVLYEFLDTPNTSHQGTLTTEKRADNEYALEFHNVSFKYPGTDTYVLKDLNLKFNIGQRMAVVGMNGSGKTTMIKLLCRLYDPTNGEITLNGIDIKKYEYAEYLGIFSVVFQDFKLFSFPLGQNVAAAVEYNNTQTEKYLEMAGLKDRLKEMQKGLDTPLYKDFEEDGVEISSGEAQKIALARALYKNAPFIILDEPTAALDPIAEFEIYSKFNEIVGDKTAIYISHRLSSCRFCDDIAVFHEGELIQRGNHDILLSDKDGKYFEFHRLGSR